MTGQRPGNLMAPTGSGHAEWFLLLTCSHLEAVEVAFRPGTTALEVMNGT